MHESRDGFTFVDGDRTFTCHTAPLRPGQSEETWWWFQVSTERSNRHAPFRAQDGDTRKSVQERVVAFYDHLLERRAAPPEKRWSRKPAAATQAPAATAPASTVQ